ncbi:MAG: DODA-type extradiol aromatic ring-opening family dioxygenase [Polyangiaceae bacterium]
MTTKQPTFYVPHGGGPCFFMEWKMGPPDTWDALKAWLEKFPTTIAEPPRALLVVSAHWEAKVPTVTTAPVTKLYFDYSGFPPHTYELTWPVPAAGDVASRVRELLQNAGIESAANDSRGLDHGVFVPMKVSFPDAKIPTVQLSLRAGLDPEEHLKIGRALAPLRDEGVLIVGSGMSYHNMRGLMTGDGDAHASSKRFDEWLVNVARQNSTERDQALGAWKSAPLAHECHPREEHLIPLMVVAGAAMGDRGEAVFRGEVMNVAVSALRFG